MIIRALSKGNREKGTLKEYKAKPNITESLTVKGIKECYTVKTDIPTHPSMKDDNSLWYLDYGKGPFDVIIRTWWDDGFKREVTIDTPEGLESPIKFEVDPYNTRNVCNEVISKAICASP